MARMHIRRKGKSHSTRPVNIALPKWLKDRPGIKEEIDQIITELAKKGTPPSKIGLILRDKYGVPLVRAIYGKKLKKVLEEKNLAPQIPEDLMNLLKKAVHLNDHLKKHRKDLHNKRGLQLVESKIQRLAKYYKRRGVLPANCRYSREQASVMVSRI